MDAAAKKPLDGAVALVTGASRGIGLAIAHTLGNLGARLSICARDAGRLQTAAEELRQDGATVMAKVADVTRANDVEALLRETEHALGPVEILVNNAGIGLFIASHEATEENWDAVLDTNLKSVFLLSKGVAPGMIRRQSGHIINIASLSGKSAYAGGALYCASKWGLRGFTECMAEDLRGYGIRVSAICPGSVVTDFSAHTGKDPRKMLQPQDIAHAVEMIVTEAPQSFISEISLRPTRKP